MSRGQRTDLFISMKQRMLYEEALQKRAIEYLNTRRDDDYEPLNNKVMRMACQRAAGSVPWLCQHLFTVYT